MPDAKVMKRRNVIQGLECMIGDKEFLKGEGTEDLLKGALWWLEHPEACDKPPEPEDVQEAMKGFKIEELNYIEYRATRMADVTPNPRWKRSYYRLADAATELMGRMLKARV